MITVVRCVFVSIYNEKNKRTISTVLGSSTGSFLDLFVHFHKNLSLIVDYELSGLIAKGLSVKGSSKTGDLTRSPMVIMLVTERRMVW